MCGEFIAPAVLEVRGLSLAYKCLRRPDLKGGRIYREEHGQCHLWQTLYNSGRAGHTIKTHQQRRWNKMNHMELSSLVMAVSPFV